MGLRFYKSLLGIGTLLIALGVAMTSCAPDKSAPTLSARPAEDAVAVPQTDNAVTVAQVADVVVEPFTDFACLDCHTNEERLRELAVEKVKESLSEGPG